MRSDEAIARAVKQGFAFLECQDPAHLSIQALCCGIHAAAQQPLGNDLKQRLLTVVRQRVQLPWLRRAPLSDLCLALTVLHQHAADAITGDMLAVAVTRLLAA